MNHHLATLTLTSVLLIGCSQAPQRVPMPSYNGSASADAALTAYDSDGNGALSIQELEACPSLLASIKRYDVDGNSEISGEEINNRIDQWLAKKAAALSIRARVTMDGRPLGGASIKLVPEPFLGEAAIPAQGKLNPSGTTRLSLDQDAAPESLSGIPGILPGLYSVVITHPQKPIPERYNEKTTLGAEISYEMMAEGLNFRLKSR